MPVVELDERLTQEAVLAKIPAFSPAILRVVDLLSKPDASANTLAQAIAGDPALAAQVLRLANSALFGAQSRVDTLHKAVMAVGQTWLQHLTLTLGVSSYMKAARKTEELDLCWRHMLASAVLSRELAKMVGVTPERAYAAGLLHDIGRLGLLAAFPAEYADAVRNAVRSGDPLIEVEKDVFGTDHCEVGRRLVESWNLPAEFAVVTGQHHETPDAGKIGLQTVVQLACRLADALGFFFAAPAQPVTLDEVRRMLPEFAQSRFSPDPEHWRALLEDTLHENEPVAVEARTQAPVPGLETRPEVGLFAEYYPARRGGRWRGLLLAVALLTVLAVLHWIW